MRLKEDSNSWRASGIKRKDFRNDKSFDGVTGRRKKKNTKKWCKGKVGKKHDLEWRWSKWDINFSQRIGKQPSVKEAFCRNCEKIVEAYNKNWHDWRKDPNELYNK